MAQPTVDSRVVSKEIRARVWPRLKEAGFNHFTGRSAWRRKPQAIEVVNFQSFNSYKARSIDCRTFSFAVNLGMYYPCMHSAPWSASPIPEYPEEFKCQARAHLLKGVNQQGARPLKKNDYSTIWFADQAGYNISLLVSDALRVIEDKGIPWLDEYADLGKTVNVLSMAHMVHRPGFKFQGFSGKLDSVSRSEVKSSVLLELKRVDEAIVALERALKNPYYANKSDMLNRIQKKVDAIKHWQLKNKC